MGKTNKIDIDYQILHDAFFRFQVRRRRTIISTRHRAN